jgi:hypothetical protein
MHLFETGLMGSAIFARAFAADLLQMQQIVIIDARNRYAG